MLGQPVGALCAGKTHQPGQTLALAHRGLAGPCPFGGELGVEELLALLAQTAEIAHLDHARRQLRAGARSVTASSRWRTASPAATAENQA